MNFLYWRTIKSNQMERVHLFLPQALRYPYFQVGQVLGPQPLSQEVHTKAPVRTQPFQSKAESQSSLESVPTAHPKASSARHLQQISMPQTDHHQVGKLDQPPLRALDSNPQMVSAVSV